MIQRQSWPVEQLESRILLSAPTASNDSYNVDEDTYYEEFSPGVLGNDTDPDFDPLTAVLVSGVTHGTLNLYSDGSFDYDPDLGYIGADSFTYKANDGTNDSNVATVSLDVISSNTAPVADNDSYSVSDDKLDTVADFADSVLAYDTDADFDPLTAILVAGPSHGSLTLNSNGSFVYEPNVSFTGDDTFTYKANDGTVDSNVATVTITVSKSFTARTNLDDLPSASADSFGIYSVSKQTGEFQTSFGAGEHTLQYQSLIESQPIISPETVLSSGMDIPDSIEARLTVGGVSNTPIYFDTSSFMGDDAFGLSLQPDVSTLATDRHDYELTLIGHFGTETATRIFTGTVDIVASPDSEFGEGWGLTDLDRLVVGTDGMMLVKGSGLSSWFSDNGDDTFTSPPGPLNTTSLIRNVGGSYTLTTKRDFQLNFASSGLLTSRVDANGNTTSYTYTDADSDTVVDELSQVTSPFGRTTTFNYTSGIVSSITDFAGRTITLAHDGSDRLTSITAPDPDGAGPLTSPVTTYAYNTSDQLTSITDPLSQTTQFRYNFAGRIDLVTNPDSNTKTFDAAQMQGLPDTVAGEGTSLNPAALHLDDDMMTEVLDELGNSTSISFDRFGFVISRTDPLSNTTTSQRDSNGLLTQTTGPDPDGAGSQTAPVTSYQYDSKGNLTQITFPDSTTQSWVYDATLNRATSFTDQLSRTSSYTYDSDGNRLTSTDPAGNVTTYVYNTNGKVTSKTDPDPDGAGPLTSPVISFTYDTLGRMTKVTNPDSTTQQLAYDSADNVTSETDELGRVTTHEYDSLDRLTKTTRPDPDGAGSLSAPISTFTYDAASRLTDVTDPDGNITVYAYDNRDRLTSVTDPDPDGAGPLTSPVISYAYNARGDRTSKTDPLGNVTTYAYDSAGRLTSTTAPDPDGAGPLTAPVTSRTYDNLGRLTQVTDPLSHSTSYEHDSLDRLTKVTDALSNNTQYAYDSVGNRTTVTDALGNVTTSAFNNLNQLTSVTYADPDGAGPLSSPVKTNAYDNLGRLTSMTDPLSQVASFKYDVMGRVTDVTDPLGNVVTSTYDNVGNLLTVTAPDPDDTGPLTAPVTTFEYDDLNRNTKITDALSGVTTFEYDVLGRLTKTTDSLSRITGYTYDDLSRLTAMSLPIPAGYGPGAYPIYSYTYDAAGNMLTTVDPDSNDVTFAYDNLNRNTSITDQESGATSYEYDAAGRLTKLTDSVGNATTYAYDNVNRVTSETNALTKTRSNVYNAIGLVASQTDRNGRIKEFDYDNLYRLSEERWKNGSTVVETINYVYDAGSQLTSASDSVSDYSYTYNANGNVLTTDNNGTSGVPNVVLTYGYDDLSRTTSTTATVSSTADFKNTYQYDALSRMTRIEQTEQSGGNSVADKRVDLAYNAVGRFSTINRYADLAATDLVATSTYAYDTAGLLSDLTHAKGATTFDDFDWTHDWIYRVTSAASDDGTSNYTYDDTSQVTAATHTYQTNESYSYDLNGNRTNTGYATGTNNRLTSDGTYNYLYDDEGNRTKKTEISSGDYVEYTWDHNNRLTSVTFRDSLDVKTKKLEYDYDLFDRRIARRLDSNGNGTFDNQRRFVYDGEDIVLAYDNSSSLKNRYLHGPAVDQIFATEDGAGDLLWALADNQGTVRDWVEYDDVTDTTSVVNHLKYDAFGNITAIEDSSGSATTIDAQLAEVLYAYTGREWDADAELYFYRARWYDPAVGRFISEDPLSFTAGDTNLSRYVGNNSPNMTDPTGLFGDIGEVFEDVLTPVEDVFNQANDEVTDYLSDAWDDLIEQLEQEWENWPGIPVGGNLPLPGGGNIGGGGLFGPGGTDWIVGGTLPVGDDGGVISGGANDDGWWLGGGFEW